MPPLITGSSPLVRIGEEDQLPDQATRRRFFELMGASTALITGAGCTRPPTEFLMPYVQPPEKTLPGVPKYYATAAVVNGLAQGVIAETHLGRPTKIEGNPRHPASLGATGVLSQASVLDLYDPDRSKVVIYREQASSWDAFISAFQQLLAPVRATHGRGLRLLTETVISPSTGAQIADVLAALPEARWHQYDPAGPHSARAGSLAAFGRYLNTYYRLDRARVILSLDSDFLACGPASTRYAHDFALRRRVRGSNTAMNRLYAVESHMTATGGKADHRAALRYSEFPQFAADLAAALGAGGAAPAGSKYAAWVGPLARDLDAHRGASAIIPGEHQSPSVHALCHALNTSLGNAGSTVAYTEPLEVRSEDQIASLRELVSDMESGAVSLLLILGGNPVYNAPADLDFAGALRRVPMSIKLGLHADETSRLTHWHLPETHFYEDWGDARAYDGTVTILQPLILPLYESHSPVEVLDLLLRAPNRTSREILRAYWRGHAASGGGAAPENDGEFESWWRKSVGDGLIAGSALPEVTPAQAKAPEVPHTDSTVRSGLELVFRPDPYIYDGRYANNAWLQELPKPISKLTWDNAVHMNPRTAARLHLENQQVVELKYGGRSVRGPVWISPGDADDTITVSLGYGRTDAGVIGNGAGFDVYCVRASDALWCVAGVEIATAGASHRLAATQTEKSMHDRPLVISKPVALYESDPDFVSRIRPEPLLDETLYPQWTYTGYNWGMAIDLTACVNCNACVIACQAENNIPVVGKAEVLSHRDMHWLRVDVYYTGNPDNPSALYAPIPCMHCEQAPCEEVCPVQATVHSSDGLNDMIYNRCVGTRYCSNNCPYKVRRFNWKLYADWYTEQLKMQKNPDVTVRSRGVMEKCTYCVQRIREAEIHSQDEDRYIRDGEIQTACQQACPTQAIRFGDMNNSANQVARLKREKLNYSMLAELNTRPHTTYLAELRNPNPALLEHS
ncbi:MAG TPA: 4Fe-4S dicluster domain-containing protein [Bryobacteraceae bacterium]|nr:4Fe-4S dicluster domain-containing protein [Bryobacteraceae bacterium]